MSTMRPDFAREIRLGLTDPTKVCQALNLLERATRQAGGWLIRCPNHAEKTPSCSVTRGPDGTVRVKCFGCDFAGDSLTLIAKVHGLSTQGPEFREVLEQGAQIAGLFQLVEEIRGNREVSAARPVIAQPEPEPERDYPADIRDLPTVAAEMDTEVSSYLVSRRLCPQIATQKRLCGALAIGAHLPSWASYRGQSWAATGHRLIYAVYDHLGKWRSVRAGRVWAAESPKRLPPAGHRAAGLVLANAPALALLTGRTTDPERIIFAEGEPDWHTWAQQFDGPVFGVLSGSWNIEFAKRIPARSEILIWTHADQAGDRYADQIAKTLENKAEIWRCKP